MIQSLLTRDVRKVPDHVRFTGRVLLLTENPELLHRQLAGEDLPFDPSAPVGSPTHPKLRDNISTDEITPAYICYYFDDTLGQFPYLGLKAGEEFPLVRGSVRAGGFVASVAGTRRGKGSSREASPYAEMPTFSFAASSTQCRAKIFSAIVIGRFGVVTTGTSTFPWSRATL